MINPYRLARCMRLICSFAIGGVACAASDPSAPASSPHRGQPQGGSANHAQYANVHQPDIENRPFVVNILQSDMQNSYTDHKATHVDNKPPEDRRLEVTAIVATGFATVLLAILTYFLYRATKGLLALEGPRIIFSRVNSENERFSVIAGSGRMLNEPERHCVTFNVSFTNHGRSPAILNSVRATIKTSLTLPFLAGHFFKTSTIIDRVDCLQPDGKESQQFTIEVADVPYKAAVDGAGAILGLQILYTDVSGRKHVSTECMRIFNGGTSAARRGGKRYNHFK